jgi:hypothetical protein
MDKNALEQLLSSYNWWMGLSTVAVAIGILGEYVAHFIFEEDARRNKREMAVSILFGVLVLGGVVGEYLFGKKLSQVSERLQQMADTEVAQANRGAAAARKDAGEANQKAGQANERASVNEKETQKLRKQNLATDSALSKERITRLELEASLRPREIPLVMYTDGTSNIDDLKQLAGVEVVLEYINDAEAGLVAGNIAFLLERAGLKIVRAGPTARTLRPGVNVRASVVVPMVADAFPPTGKPMPGRPEEEEEVSPEAMKLKPGQGPQSRLYCDVIASFFMDNGWYTLQIITGVRRVGPDQVLIEVGFKPSPYFHDPQLKGSEKQFVELQRRLHPTSNNANKLVRIRELPLLSAPIRP